MNRRTLLAFGVLLAIFSLAISVTGGFTTAMLGVRVSARTAQPSAVAAAIVLGIWLVWTWRARTFCSDLTSVESWLTRHAKAIVACVASLAGAVAIHYFSFSAGSADPSGYLSQAAMLQMGHLFHAEPLASAADWPDAARMLAPLGWKPALEPGLQVPTYPAGLPLLMAPLHAISGEVGASLVLPIAFALSVWATGMLALRIAGPLAAILAAAWLATSPIVLIEAMQPMTDVPVAAAWLACWWMLVSSKFEVQSSKTAKGPIVLGALAAGVAAGIAVLIRPNLAPLAVIPAGFVLARSASRFAAVIAFSIPVAVGGMIVGYLHWRWFGSPVQSGYGPTAEIYEWSNFAANVATHARWLLSSHGPWLFLAPLALVWPQPRLDARVRWRSIDVGVSRWLLVFAAGILVAYFFYDVFETWTYLRFIIPALAVAMIVVSAMVGSLIDRLPGAAHAPVFLVVALALAATNVQSAQSLGVLRFAAVQSRAALAGRYLDAALPVNAVVIAGEQSGSVRYYTHRSIVRWDFAAGDGLGAIIDRLEDLGRDVWVALDVWEEELVRRKFPTSEAGALDWPPQVEAGTESLTRAWRLRDREVFMRGGKVVTDRLR